MKFMVDVSSQKPNSLNFFLKSHKVITRKYSLWNSCWCGKFSLILKAGAKCNVVFFDNKSFRPFQLHRICRWNIDRHKIISKGVVGVVWILKWGALMH